MQGETYAAALAIVAVVNFALAAQPMTVHIGDRMPDVELVRADGSSTSMDGLRGEATVLIFLRHLG